MNLIFQTNICKTRYGKPVQTFEDVSDKMEAELFRINRDSQERIAEKTGNYSNDLITLDSDLKDIVKVNLQVLVICFDLLKLCFITASTC